MNPNPAVHIRFGSNFGPLTWTGEEWRLLTSAFLHFGLIHIALNMFALYQGGGLVERLFGSTRFAVIYLLSALSGSVASGWWDPLRNSAGASGAIFGVYGALLAFLAVRRADIPPHHAEEHQQQRAAVLPVLAGHRRRASAHRQRLPRRRVVRRVRVGRDPGAAVHAGGACHAAAGETAAGGAGHPALPLALLAQPLTAESGSKSASLRFERDLETFGRAEAEIVRRQTDILTFPPNARVNRLEIAQRLRREVLEPWRTASRPLLAGAPRLPQDDSRSCAHAGRRFATTSRPRKRHRAAGAGIRERRPQR